MAISDDIKEVLAEIGTAMTLHNSDGTDTTGLYLDFEGYPDQSTLLTRMFARLGSVAADTPVKQGSIVSFSGAYFLVTNIVPTYFENAVVENVVFFYKCNVVGSFLKYSNSPEYDANYERVSAWTPIVSDLPVCFFEKTIFEAETDMEGIFSNTQSRMILYIPSIYNVEAGDRFQLSTGGTFKIEMVVSHAIEGCLVCAADKDER